MQSPSTDFSDDIAKKILEYVGRELVCNGRCGRKTFPPENVRDWNVQRQTEKTIRNMPYECLKMFLYLIRNHDTLILTASIKEGKSLKHIFNKAHILFTPVSQRTGHITFTGGRIQVETLVGDFLRLFRSFKGNKFF